MTTKQEKQMKVQTPKDSPIAVLFVAAKEIIDGTRNVMAKHDRAASEVRIPILIHGTDMRVTIEAGPRVAARNAIEQAQMEASGKPAGPRIDLTQVVLDARELLSDAATSLKQAHTVNGEWPEYDDDAKALHAHYLKTIEGLTEVEKFL